MRVHACVGGLSVPGGAVGVREGAVSRLSACGGAQGWREVLAARRVRGVAGSPPWVRGVPGVLAARVGVQGCRSELAACVDAEGSLGAATGVRGLGSRWQPLNVAGCVGGCSERGGCWQLAWVPRGPWGCWHQVWVLRGAEACWQPAWVLRGAWGCW